MVIFLGLSALLLLAYEIYFFGPVLRFRFRDKPAAADEPVSVIIAAHNEAEALRRHLPAFFRQDYPDYQVVVIDDRSTDHTPEVLDEMKHAYGDRLHVVRVQPQEWESFRANKKFALTLGIKAARYDKLLFTDADCVPASEEWIARMSAGLQPPVDFVLGYGRYRREKGFLNTLIRFETLQTGIQYASFALRGLPYMGVGRNLAYRRSFFLERNGYGRFFSILSGDDDLFVNQHAGRDNTRLCLHPEAHTVSEPERTWRRWIRQKRRHLSTAPYYRTRHKMLLGFYALARFLFWWGVVPGVFISGFHPMLTGLALARMAWTGMLWYRTARRWQDALPWAALLPAEWTLIFIYMYISLLNLIRKPTHWH
ncbi:MAG: glycosyltransferase [Chlorobi bacterium]|nr:glycosyltransferase [Chlorobiota bacterium]